MIREMTDGEWDEAADQFYAPSVEHAAGLALARKLCAIENQRDALLAALKLARAIAGEAAREWDADHDSRVGKLLIALAGRTGYRADIDSIHATITNADGLVGECPGCGCSKWACDAYKTSGKVCCPDCTHSRASASAAVSPADGSESSAGTPDVVPRSGEHDQ